MIEFQLSTSGPSFISQGDHIRITQTVARAVIKAAKPNILFMAVETSCKLKAHPTARAVLHLAWENVTTDVTCGGWVYSYRPRPPTSYSVCRKLVAVQWIRWLAEVQWQVMAQALKWPGRVWGSVSLCVLPGWAKQTTEFMTITFSHTVQSTSTPALRTSANQSIKQYKHL